MSSAAPEHSHHADDSHAHGSYRSYVIGFVLSVVLTAIPFALVMGDVIADTRLSALVLMGFAVVQMVVHMVYFLHMNRTSEEGWLFSSLLFSLVLVLILLSGSLWVMHHLNTNMMPIHDMSQM